MPASMVSVDERSGRSSSRPADLEEVEHELARLETMDLTQLRVQFRNLTGRVAPTRISRSLLLRLIGYRLQAEHFGDLPPDTKRFLDRLASASAGSSSDAARPNERASVAAAEGSMRPRTGTVLVREWQGRLEQVRVLPDGFGWNGGTYASLSAVASAMTGTRWNGHRFFGLGRHGKVARAALADKVDSAQSGRAAQVDRAASIGKAEIEARTASMNRLGRTGESSAEAGIGKAGAAVEAAPLRRTSRNVTPAHADRAVCAVTAPVSTAAVFIPPARAAAGAIA